MWRVGKRVGLARHAIRQGADMPAAGSNRLAPFGPHYTLLGWRAGHELERTVTPGQTFTRTVSRAAVGQVGGSPAGYVNQLDPRACCQKADRLPVGVRRLLGACLKLPRGAPERGRVVGAWLLLPQKDPCIRGRSSRGCWLESRTDLSLTQSACAAAAPGGRALRLGKPPGPSDKCGAGSVAEQQKQQQPHHPAKCPCAAPIYALTHLPAVLILLCHLVYYPIHTAPSRFNTVSITNPILGYFQTDFIKENWTVHFAIDGCYRSLQAAFDVLKRTNFSHNEGIEAGRFLGLISGPN